MQTMYVERLAGGRKEEKIAALKQQLQALHQSGQIDAHTQVIINLHGSITDKSHELSNAKNEFSLDTSELVSLIRETAALPGQEVAANSWQGTIHVSACGAGRASQDLKDGAGITLLYAGRKVKLSSDSGAIFKEIIRQLGEYRKDPVVNKFPSAQDFYEAAGAISGEKVHMAGRGNLFHIRLRHLPHPTELTQTAVRERLERFMDAKILHGKAVSVQNAFDVLKIALKNVKASPPIFLLLLLNEHATEVKEKIKFLVQGGVDINAVVKQRMSVLGVAIDQRRLNRIQVLIDAGADVHTTTSPDRNSALHLACELGDTELAKWLIEKGADLHRENALGLTPLSLAIRSGHADLASSLLCEEAAAGKAISKDYDLETLMLLLGSGHSVLRNQVLARSPDKPRLLASLFSELQEQLRNGYESIYYTADDMRRDLSMLRPFVREMLYVHEKMPDHFMSFMTELCMSPSVSDYLPAILAIPNFSEKLAADLEALRDICLEFGWTRACQFLEAGLALKLEFSERIDRDLRQLEVPDASGFTPFERACRENGPTKLTILAAGGVQFKQSRSMNGLSPLMLACEAGALDVVQWLWDKGVDFTVRDRQGRSALDYAIASGHAAVEAYVRRHLPDSATPSDAPAMQ